MWREYIFFDVRNFAITFCCNVNLIVNLLVVGPTLKFMFRLLNFLSKSWKMKLVFIVKWICFFLLIPSPSAHIIKKGGSMTPYSVVLLHLSWICLYLCLPLPLLCYLSKFSSLRYCLSWNLELIVDTLFRHYGSLIHPYSSRRVVTSSWCCCSP